MFKEVGLRVIKIMTTFNLIYFHKIEFNMRRCRMETSIHSVLIKNVFPILHVNESSRNAVQSNFNSLDSNFFGIKFS